MLGSIMECGDFECYRQLSNVCCCALCALCCCLEHFQIQELGPEPMDSKIGPTDVDVWVREFVAREFKLQNIHIYQHHQSSCIVCLSFMLCNCLIGGSWESCFIVYWVVAWFWFSGWDLCILSYKLATMALFCGVLLALAVSDVGAFTNGRSTSGLLSFGRTNNLISSQRIMVQNRIVPLKMTATSVNLADVGNDIVILPSDAGISSYHKPVWSWCNIARLQCC